MKESLQVENSDNLMPDNEFAGYFSSYFKKITKYIFRFIKNYSISEEIAQDVFLKLYKNQGKLQKNNLKSWLYKVAHNDSINYLKKNSLDTSDLENHFVEPFTLETPQKIVDDKAEKELIYNLIMKLPKNQRTALLLKEVKDYSYEQISKEMGLSNDAVKSLIYRGRQKLAKYYREAEKNEV